MQRGCQSNVGTALPPVRHYRKNLPHGWNENVSWRGAAG
jgi:hypothetical protein